jgi:hypothetical protein
MTCGVGNPGPVLGQPQHVAGLNRLITVFTCDEWDRVVALPRHKFVTGATLLQLGQQEQHNPGICCFS